MTIPPIVFWAVAVTTVLTAVVPVTQERLGRFAELTGFSVTTADARQVVGYFTGIRRWRLVALIPAVPLAVVTDNPFYLVLGWCAAGILGHRRRHTFHPAPYRTVWALGLSAALAACGYLLVSRELTPEALVQTAVVVIVAAAVTRLAAAPALTDETTRAGLAIGHWSTRSLYLSGTAVVLSGALLTPGQASDPALPDHTMPKSFPEERAAFDTVRKYKGPGCPFNRVLDAPCRSWQVNGQPFPQAAPYIMEKGKAPRRAPFARSHDRKAVVYLDRRHRRMTYQNAGETRALTGPLTDGAVPTVTFARQSRYVALARHGGRVVDTKTWATLSIPGVRRIHDLNDNGIVATTSSRVLVLDHRGKERMSRSIREVGDGVVMDVFHLSPDGRHFLIINGLDGVETFDVRTGELLADVTLAFPDDDYIDVGLGWTERGLFLLRDGSERVYTLDPATGELRKRGTT